MSASAHKYLIWGGNGWIAGLLKTLLTQTGKTVSSTTVRMEDRAASAAVLDAERPTHVLNCAGCTGRPNVDWCEDNQAETIRSNVIGTLSLADLCHERGVHCTVFATGCIYRYQEPGEGPHTLRSGNGYTENDPANFDGSFYSKTKAVTEGILREYPHVLVLRLRMPVSDALEPRNFVTKILAYERVVDVPNSMTILHDLLPAAVAMAEHGATGVYNFTNPGAISHNEVLGLFRDVVRPECTWRNFSLDEQAKVIKAGRSNCELDPSKMVDLVKGYGIEIPEIHVAYRQCFERMKAAGVR